MKKIFSFVMALACVLTLSCQKGGGEDQPTGTPQLGVSVKDAVDVFEVPKNQSISLSLAVTAEPTSAEAYTITLGANPALVAVYNTKHGTSYEMLPSSAYAFTSTQVMLPRYSAKSTNAELRLKGDGVTEDQVFLLPVEISAVQGGTNFQAPEDKAAYILFKMLAAQQQGSGTQADPYIIADADGLLAMGSLLKDAQTTFFKLSADIDLSGLTFTTEKPWVPINPVPSDDEGAGVARARKIALDGNNHKISNFTADQGLFGIFCGSVKDLSLENFQLDGDNPDTAPLISVAGAGDKPEEFVMTNVHVSNCSIETQNERAGGIIGRMRHGSVENCSVTSCTVAAKNRTGGMVGYVDDGSFTGCSTSGSVTSSSAYSGGLMAWCGDVTVKNCHSSANVTSLCEDINYVRGGGLIGQLEGNATIEKSYATGNVAGGPSSSKGHMAGGLIGVIGRDDITVNISECYATGNVTIPTNERWAHAGALVGTIDGTGKGAAPVVYISNCYATGAVTARRYSSGFVGSVYQYPGKMHVTNSYSTSDLSGIALQTACGILLGCADALSSGTELTSTGFVAWGTGEFTIRRYKNDKDEWVWGNNGPNAQLIIPVDGNYWGTEGTVSQQAQLLGWSTDIWDFNSDLPKLKNVQ